MLERSAKIIPFRDAYEVPLFGYLKKKYTRNCGLFGPVSVTRSQEYSKTASKYVK